MRQQCVAILNNATEDKPFSYGGQRNRLKSSTEFSAPVFSGFWCSEARRIEDRRRSQVLRGSFRTDYRGRDQPCVNPAGVLFPGPPAS
jgi:hypothetical protein